MDMLEGKKIEWNSIIWIIWIDVNNQYDHNWFLLVHFRDWINNALKNLCKDEEEIMWRGKLLIKIESSSTR